MSTEAVPGSHTRVPPAPLDPREVALALAPFGSSRMLPKSAYLDPEVLGLSASLPLGKHSGRHAFAQACADAGLALDAAQLKDAFVRFKGLADAGAANAFEVAVS